MPAGLGAEHTALEQLRPGRKLSFSGPEEHPSTRRIYKSQLSLRVPRLASVISSLFLALHLAEVEWGGR